MGAGGPVKGYQPIRKRLRFLIATKGWTVDKILEIYTGPEFGKLPYVDGLCVKYAVKQFEKGASIESFLDQHDGPQKEPVREDGSESGDIDEKHKIFLSDLYDEFQKRLAVHTLAPVSNGHANAHDNGAHAGLGALEPEGDD